VSIGNFLSQSSKDGEPAGTSYVFLTAILMLLTDLALTRKDEIREVKRQ